LASALLSGNGIVRNSTSVVERSRICATFSWILASSD
jgi:hypothetical protein